MTFADLIAAYQAGEITEPMWLDNDAAYVYTGDSKVFEMHPRSA